MLRGITFLGENDVPQELDWSPILLMSVFLATIGFMSTGCVGLLVAKFEQDLIVVTPLF